MIIQRFLLFFGGPKIYTGHMGCMLEKYCYSVKLHYMLESIPVTIMLYICIYKMGQLGVSDSQGCMQNNCMNQLLFAMALFGNIIEINGFAATYFPDQLSLISTSV